MQGFGEERAWLVAVPLLIRELLLRPLDVLSLSLTCPFLRVLTHEHGVCRACDDVHQDGIVWKTIVWSKRMSERMYLDGILRSDIVICIPQDTCRHCRDAKATLLLQGWWIEDEPPNDSSMPAQTVMRCRKDAARRVASLCSVHTPETYARKANCKCNRASMRIVFTCCGL